MVDTCSSTKGDIFNKEFMEAQDKALADFDDDILTQDILNYFCGKAHIDEDGNIVVDDDYSDGYFDAYFGKKDHLDADDDIEIDNECTCNYFANYIDTYFMNNDPFK